MFATQSESEILNRIPGIIHDTDSYRFGSSEINVLITGVGGISTSWSLGKWFSSNPKPDLAINAGIAGSYSENLKPGDVVLPVVDCFADMGIELNNKYITLAEAGLTDPDSYPFENNWIKADNEYIDQASLFLHKCRAVTVNTSSGSRASIDRITGKFNPDIETMEGATFFYICALERIPFLAIRAISNMVEAGSRVKWEVSLALKNLAEMMNRILNLF